jgi:hypothetical protein
MMKFIPGFEHSSEMTRTAREVYVDGALTYDKVGKIPMMAHGPSDDWAGDAEDEVPEPSRTRQPLRPAIHEFNAERASSEAFHAFSDMLETEAFHNATRFREQVALAVEHLRLDGPSITYGQIGKIFGMSKGVVTQH